ncbi:tryptophan synthase subunit alpha [Haliovirga abyssi]|uniref:Tryptophan synthase alpha chain n=1 Tax=Haliovirga abyssi TaxID=2996794 RepID=A0AAU9DES2_9FUSO|nr:tryptophan synthase subunit alpha [Haliovirga abyssi]BDU50693.1 tryptophan synthase subunit alpha [Haliovirga abyssi]
MNISEKFKKLGKNNEKALITYVAGGDPNYGSSKKIIKALIKGGADIVEIGIPFSDPMADGPVIQAAAERALKNKFSLKDALKLVGELREEDIENPLLFMSYYNPIYSYGIEKFIKDAKKVGVNGVIIPDLPPEESDEFYIIAEEYDFNLIMFLAPTMTEERLEKVISRANGFIYFVSVAGITGARKNVNENLENLIKKVKEKTEIPIGIGFGISSKEHVKGISKFADASIVGSAIVRKIEENLDNEEKMLEEIEEFVRELKSGTK